MKLNSSFSCCYLSIPDTHLFFPLLYSEDKRQHSISELSEKTEKKKISFQLRILKKDSFNDLNSESRDLFLKA